MNYKGVRVYNPDGGKNWWIFHPWKRSWNNVVRLPQNVRQAKKYFLEAVHNIKKWKEPK